MTKDEYVYFYIAYHTGSGFGSAILPQGRGPSENCLNYASASQVLMNTVQAPVIIIFSEKVTKTRFEDWNKFLMQISNQSGVKTKGSHLSIVPKEEEKKPDLV